MKKVLKKALKSVNKMWKNWMWKNWMWNVLYFIAFSLVIALIVFAKVPSIDSGQTVASKEIEKPQKALTISLMISYLNPKVDPFIAHIISTYIEEHVKIFPKELIVSLIFKESSFNPLAVSSANCIGLMQINPEAHPDKIEGLERHEIFYISNNIRIGNQILEEYYKQEGNIKGALIRYFGANNKSYIEDILSNTVNLMMLSK